MEPDAARGALAEALVTADGAGFRSTVPSVIRSGRIGAYDPIAVWRGITMDG